MTLIISVYAILASLDQSVKMTLAQAIALDTVIVRVDIVDVTRHGVE